MPRHKPHLPPQTLNRVEASVWECRQASPILISRTQKAPPGKSSSSPSIVNGHSCCWIWSTRTSQSSQSSKYSKHAANSKHSPARRISGTWSSFSAVSQSCSHLTSSSVQSKWEQRRFVLTTSKTDAECSKVYRPSQTRNPDASAPNSKPAVVGASNSRHVKAPCIVQVCANCEPKTSSITLFYSTPCTVRQGSKNGIRGPQHPKTNSPGNGTSKRPVNWEAPIPATIGFMKSL